MSFAEVAYFFIALGVAFLCIAGAYMGPEHSSYSFVTVVLGVGILLFGTGTQSVGRFQTNRAAAAMAGGAGVLTFCVAFGMIYFQDRIQSAFEVQKKYFILRLEPHGDGSSTFANYMARVTMNGVDVPVMKRGNDFLVYVPYLEQIPLM